MRNFTLAQVHRHFSGKPHIQNFMGNGEFQQGCGYVFKLFVEVFTVWVGI